MASPIVFTKQLAAAVSNNIAASQSGSAGVALTLNGTASNYLSTTTTAAAAAGATVLALTSVTGVTVGQAVTDSTILALPTMTVVTGIDTAAKTVHLSLPVGGVSGVGSGDTIVFAGTATIDTATAANSAIGRRVVLAYTGTDTSFTIVGTNSTGNAITDVAVGSSGAAQSNMDFVTVTGITPVGGGLTGVTAGTNGVGSSPWKTLNWHATSVMNTGFEVELVSGAVNFTIQHTYDDPNNLLAGAAYPNAINHPVVAGASATTDGVYALPIAAIRVLINSGTGEIRIRVLQSSIG